MIGPEKLYNANVLCPGFFWDLESIATSEIDKDIQVKLNSFKIIS